MPAFIIFPAMAITMCELLNIAGSIYYDINEIIKSKLYAKYKNTKRFKNKPLVTVIIATNNNQTTIEDCLKSVVRSGYRKREILIIDNNSKDQTVKIIERLQKKYPKQNIRLTRKRRKSAAFSTIKSASKTHAKGGIICALDARSSLHKSAIANAVRDFQSDRSLQVVMPRQAVRYGVSRTPFSPSFFTPDGTAEPRTGQLILGLLQAYHSIFAIRYAKSANIFNATKFNAGLNTFYKRSLFTNGKSLIRLRPQGNVGPKSGVQYASNAIVYSPYVRTYVSFAAAIKHAQEGTVTKIKNNFQQPKASKLNGVREPVNSIKNGLAAIFKLILAINPYILISLMYFALLINGPLLFLAGWSGLTFIVLSAVLSDETLNVLDKITLFVLSPVSYILIFILAIIHMAVLLRHIKSGFTSNRY